MYRVLVAVATTAVLALTNTAGPALANDAGTATPTLVESLPSFDVTFEPGIATAGGGRFFGEIDWLDAYTFRVYGHVRDICPNDNRAAIGQFYLNMAVSDGFSTQFVNDNTCGYLRDYDFTYTVHRSQVIQSAWAQISVSETGNHNEQAFVSGDRQQLWNPYR